MVEPKSYAQPTRRPPSHPRAEESRTRIMSEARRLFAQRGFDGANIREIAEKAGVTHTLIRYHFGSKEQLWKDVVTDMFRRLDREVSGPETEKLKYETVDDLRIFLRRYVKYCAKNPDQIRIMFHESIAGGDRLDWMVKYILKSHQTLTPFFRHLMDKGQLPDVFLVSLFYAVSTICQIPFAFSTTIKKLYGVDMQSEAATEAHVDAVLAILLRDAPDADLKRPALPAWTKI
ncbi:MAG: TetR/AcrR family transcriptional regulator [Henriciella sp.]|uniref:TetR/AcrR family transcriptional regulator n=1 Tax=Henriciella sp. TaxID=1968823 RepID=UPI003C744754